MKKYLGTILFFLGIVLALFVGIYLMFICGIADGIDAFQQNPIDGMRIAIDAAKVVFSGFVGWLFFVLGYCCFLYIRD